MRLQKSLPLFLVVAFTMALAMGCAPAEQAAETPAATESGEEMGHDDSMAMPDSAMADTTGGMGHEGEEGSSGH